MDEINVFQIQPGWTAYDVKAEKIGVALERGSTYVLVETEASYRRTSTSHCRA